MAVAEARRLMAKTAKPSFFARMDISVRSVVLLERNRLA